MKPSRKLGVEALRIMKSALYCENIDEQNKAYECAIDALAPWADVMERMK